MKKILFLIVIVLSVSLSLDCIAQKGGEVRTKWTIGKKKQIGCPRLGLCKLKEIKIKTYKLEDTEDEIDGDLSGNFEAKPNINSPYINNSCDELAPDEAILIMKIDAIDSRKLDIHFLTQLMKSDEEIADSIFEIEENLRLSNVLIGKFDGGTFTIMAGEYQVRKDEAGKMMLTVNLL